MNWVIYLFGSGAAFFLGGGFLLAAVGIRAYARRAWLGGLATVFTILGMVLITLSATPLPYAGYLAGAAVLVAWLYAEESKRESWQRRRGWLRGAVVFFCLLGALMEVPYLVSPSLRVTGSPILYIIGDSVTAGLGERDAERWPGLLAQANAVAVRDFSRMGATVATALLQAESLPADGGLVLLQIGGNDMLGSTRPAKFAQDLEQLLRKVCLPNRAVLMFELPLLPFANEYGRAQRWLASRYGVLLIPKRVFVAVLTGEGATVDSLHLTRFGQQRMAEAVWALIRPAYEQ